MKYNLYKLGAFQFEEIIKTLLKAELGIGMESWGGHKDYGIDVYFKGELKYPSNIKNKGIFIFQVKFTNLLSRKKAFESIKEGFINWAKNKRFEMLTAKNKKIFYTLITNVPLTSNQRMKLKKQMKEILKIRESRIIINDGKDICNLLDKHPEVRYSYPQILGLQDLKYIISKAINKPFFERSKILIEEAHDYSQIFVPTSPYRRAMQVLQKHSFVVLEGPPEVGKTVTAYIIALNKLKDGWEVFDCKIPEDFFRGYNVNKKQLFVADDAFGTTEYDPSRSDEWARELHRILRKLDRKHWFIWTTRSHILKMAKEKMDLKEQAERFPEPGDVIVNVDEFTKLEKALILYRHAKNKNLDEEGKFLVKNYWSKIIDNPHFTPLRIRNFLKDFLPQILKKFSIRKKKKEKLEKMIEEYIKKPTESLRKAFNNLPDTHQRFLFAMLDCEYMGEADESELKKAFERHCKNCNIEFNKILNELQGSFVVSSFPQWKRTKSVKWIHPSIRDLLIEILKKNNKFKNSFIRNCYVNGIGLILIPSDENKPSDFLLTEKDWIDISENIKTSMQTFTTEEIVKLLRNIKENKDIYLNSEYKEYFLNLLKMILKETKNFIENIDKLGPIENIHSINNLIFIMETFYELSLLFFPDKEVTSLDLTLTWKSLSFVVKNSLVSSLYIGDKKDIFKNLISFKKIIEKYEPRYLLKYNWDKEIKEISKIYVKEIKEELEYGVSLDDDPAAYYAEADLWDDIAEQLRELKQSFGDYNKEIDELINESEQKADYYRYVVVDYEAEEPEETYYYSEPEKRYIEHIDISRIFEDL